jgi:hypothetical protein
MKGKYSWILMYCLSYLLLNKKPHENIHEILKNLPQEELYLAIISAF